jgi:hypothetical protein
MSAHGRVLDAAVDASSTGLTANLLGRLLERRRAVTGNALLAAVLGANDGLVANLRPVMSAAGGNFTSRTVLIRVSRVLLRGALSMAMGEWV